MFGALFDTEKITRTTIQNCLEEIAIELNCSHTEFFVKIKPVTDDFEMIFQIFKGEQEVKNEGTDYIQNALEKIAVELNCSHTEFFVMIKPVTEDFLMRFHVFKHEKDKSPQFVKEVNLKAPKLIREISLKEILGKE